MLRNGLLIKKGLGLWFLALIAATSFCGGVRHKRYSGEQESAPETTTS
ncbi:hypothetical protein [Flavobacterium fluviatile]|nr:hypothetical protein [Flavobacterium fluviatile]